MIARTWTGTVRRSDADEYAEYIRETGFAEYGQTPGNRGAWMLRRDEGERTEFITLSLWESEDAIRSFAGDDIEAAVLYPEDERYLIGGESAVAHYEVVDEVAPSARAGLPHFATGRGEGHISEAFLFPD
jgi:heme-degrading monooxygenase HmoA